MNIEEFLAKTATEGGCTVWITPEKFDGYLVGGSCPGCAADRLEDIKPADVAQLIVRASGVADTVGSWTDDEDSGRVYLDGNEWIADLASATKLARERGERAIWDIANRKEIYV